MLTEREKKRIKNEEEFRASLKKVPNTPNTIWSVLNSTFIIWLLSSVIIGGFGWIYAGWEESLRNEEAIHKLDIEVDGRFEAIENALPTSGEPPYYAANSLLLPPGQQNAIQSEFANRNLKSLLYELKARVPLEEREPLMLVMEEMKIIEATLMNKEMTRDGLIGFQEKLHDIQDRRWNWEKMSKRELQIHNRSNRFVIWFLLVLLSLFSVLAVFGVGRWFRRFPR